jgi:CRP-like cAMP-binding protein
MEDILKQLKNMPLFSLVDENDLKGIADHLEEVSFEKDAVIIKEGDEGDGFYIIEDGLVNVLANLPDEEENIKLSRLKKGDYFGEMSLITGAPRSATIVAETDIKLLKLLKKDFDTYILNNSAITISLTHKLSERLIASNKALRQREKYYKDKIFPKGKLKDVDIIKLLKYCEDNSLTGNLILRNNTQLAVLTFKKGQVEKIDYNGKNENEAMDEIINWDKGEFIIEPVIFKVNEEDEAAEEPVTAEEEVFEEPTIEDSLELLQHYLEEKLQEIIRFAGSKTLKTVVDNSFKKFDKYFNLKKILTIKVHPKLKIKILKGVEITDKVALSIAVLLSDIVNSVEHEVFGIQFWEPQSIDMRINSYLKSKQFFDYYEQAGDFTHM